MATRKERLTKRVIYSVPSPSPWDVVWKEIGAAREEYKKLTGETWDNIPMVESWDSEIHIWFEVEVKEEKTP